MKKFPRLRQLHIYARDEDTAVVFEEHDSYETAQIRASIIRQFMNGLWDQGFRAERDLASLQSAAAHLERTSDSPCIVSAKFDIEYECERRTFLESVSKGIFCGPLEI